MTQQNNEAFSKVQLPELVGTLATKKDADVIESYGKACARTAWQAATQHSESILQEQQNTIAELKERLECMQDAVNFNYNRYYEAQAHINVLREAIAEIASEAQDTYTNAALTKLLAATPAQSLQAHDDEVIERCAALIEPNEEHRRDASWGFIGGEEGVELLANAAESIRALKGTL